MAVNRTLEHEKTGLLLLSPLILIHDFIGSFYLINYYRLYHVPVPWSHDLRRYWFEIVLRDAVLVQTPMVKEFPVVYGMLPIQHREEFG